MKKKIQVFIKNVFEIYTSGVVNNFIFVKYCQVKIRRMNKFGEIIRQLREEKALLLRHVAAQLDIDTAMLSKVERGERNVKREHVLMLSKILDIEKNDLLTLWLADRIYEVIENEEVGLNALKVAEEQANYKNIKK